MKQRLGFVSNSSSSSYVCNLCGRQIDGWDISLSDYEMSQCEHYHIFCDKHAVGLKEIDYYEMSVKELLKIIKEKGIWVNEDHLEDPDPDFLADSIQEYIYEEGSSEDQCPVCTFKHLNFKDVALYFLKKNNIDLTELKKTIKDEYKKYSVFKGYIGDLELL